jgi:hypothetical protein
MQSLCREASAARYLARGGLFACEAVALLRDFYLAGNAAGAARHHCNCFCICCFSKRYVA